MRAPTAKADLQNNWTPQRNADGYKTCATAIPTPKRKHAARQGTQIADLNNQYTLKQQVA